MRTVDSQAKIVELAPLLNEALMRARLAEYSGRIGVPGHRVNGPRRGHHLTRGSDMPKGTPGRRICSIDGCENVMIARGWCNMHYSRWKGFGDPLASTQRSRTVAERFWFYVEKNGPVPEYAPGLGPCWLWTGAHHPLGYGRFWSGERDVASTHWSWEQVNGPVPDGLHLDHLCRVPACVNPAHLEPVTCRENLHRGIGTLLIRKVGTENPQAKLSPTSVREIRRLASTGMSHSEIARRFGVSRRNVGMIAQRKTWAHI